MAIERLFIGNEDMSISVYRAGSIDRHDGSVACIDSQEGEAYIGLGLTLEEAEAVANKLLEIINEAKKERKP